LSKKTKTFREWFYNDYLMQSPLSSVLLNGNKATIEELRKEIATEFFVTMRCALDYIHYAALFINVYQNKEREVNKKLINRKV